MDARCSWSQYLIALDALGHDRPETTLLIPAEMQILLTPSTIVLTALHVGKVLAQVKLAILTHIFLCFHYAALLLKTDGLLLFR